MIFTGRYAKNSVSDRSAVRKRLPTPAVINASFNKILKILRCRIPNLHAPESIAVDDKGNLYAGLHDGRIVKVHPSSDGGVGLGTIETITTGVFPGYETTDGSSHGRPMGELFCGKATPICGSSNSVTDKNVVKRYV